MTGLIYCIGIIISKLPNTLFRVQIIEGKIKLTGSNFNEIILCYLCGKMRINYVKLVIGDKVKIEINKLYPQKGRIVSRIK